MPRSSWEGETSGGEGTCPPGHLMGIVGSRRGDFGCTIMATDCREFTPAPRQQSYNLFQDGPPSKGRIGAQ